MSKTDINAGVVSSFTHAVTLLKLVFLANVFNDDEFLTPLLSGSYGQGKTTAIKNVVKEMNRGRSTTYFCVDGGLLGEGELAGYPIPTKDIDGNTILDYAPYKSFAAIGRLQKQYWEKAQKDGFLGGTVKLLSDGRVCYPLDANNPDSTNLGYIEAHDDIDKAILGVKNQFMFGDELPAEVKMKLLSSNEIRPAIFFIDEINRTDNATMKNIMNVILNRDVNGYKIPWWVFCAAASNPAGGNYTVTEMDPAQIDRFLKIPVQQNFTEWVEYEMSAKKMSTRYLIGLSKDASHLFAPDNISGRDGESSDTSSSYDSETPNPSPRSHELLGILDSNLENIMNSGFFTDDEKADMTQMLHEVIKDKLSNKFGGALITNIENADSLINPELIITGKEDTVNEKIARKFEAMDVITEMINLCQLTDYLLKTVFTTNFLSTSSSDAKERAECRTTFGHCANQIKDLQKNILTNNVSNQLYFARRIIRNVTVLDMTRVKHVPEDKLLCENNKSPEDKKSESTAIFGTLFSADILQTLNSAVQSFNTTTGNSSNNG